jgi:hypothetical protein
LTVGKPISLTGYSKKNLDELMARAHDAMGSQMGEYE